MFGRDARDVPAEGTYTNRGTGPHGVTTGPGATTATHPTNDRGIVGAVMDAAETVKDKTLETTDAIGNRMRGDPARNDYGRDTHSTYGTTGAHMHGTTDNYGVGNTTGTHAYSREHASTPTSTGTYGPGNTVANTTGHTYYNDPEAYGANSNIEDRGGERRTLGQQTRDTAATVGEKTRDAVDVVAEKMHR